MLEFMLVYFHKECRIMLAREEEYEINRIVRKLTSSEELSSDKLRRTLDIAEKDALEIYVDGSTIILKNMSRHVSSAAMPDVTTYKAEYMPELHEGTKKISRFGQSLRFGQKVN